MAEFCLIAAAGPVEDYAALRPDIDGASFILSADGGLTHLEKLGLKPDVLIGDFDSYSGTLPAGVKTLRVKKEKDETDTFLAAQYALRNGYRDIRILGGMGGRLDHTAANFCTLRYIAENGGRGMLCGSGNMVYFLHNGAITLKKREGYYISVFPFGGEASGVFENGLKYSLSNASLKPDFPVGVSNEFSGDTAEISVKTGDLLIILSSMRSN